jgi:hypothetical protein
VTVRDFREHATEMFRSDDVILVTREGTPVAVDSGSSPGDLTHRLELAELVVNKLHLRDLARVPG